MEVELRVTDRCQLRCEHCYVDAKQGRGIMWDIQDFSVVSDFISAYMDCLGARERTDKISVRISGGEPLLLGFKKLEKLSEEILKKIEPVTLGIVSNFLSYTSDIGKVAKDFNWVVFTSYDPGIRFHRKELESLWIRNVHRALSEGLEVIVSVVLTRKCLESNVVSYLKGIGFRKIYFAPFASSGRGEVSGSYLKASREEIVDFIINLLENEKEMKLIPFTDLRDRYISFLRSGKGKAECWSDCWNDIGINPDFTVTSIGMCWGDPYYGRIERGNIRNSVHSIINSRNRLAFMKAKLFGLNECISCEYYGFCRGGCMSMDKHPSRGECRGLKRLLDYCIKIRACDRCS